MNLSNLKFFDRDGVDMQLSQSDGVWTGNVFFQPLSVALYDCQNLFLLEKVGEFYEFPAMSPGDVITAKWYKSEDEDFMFMYDVLVDPSTGLPYISKIDYFSQSYDSSVVGKKMPMQINVAFTASDEISYTRTLRLFLNGSKFAEIVFYGEGVDEDERFKVWLANFGLKFNREDAVIIKDYDIKEAMPDWLEINTKRKEILLNRDETFGYIGTYRGLVNMINIMGYRDIMHIKEYWRNIDKSSPYYDKFLITDMSQVLDEGAIDSLNLIGIDRDVKYSNAFKKTGFIALTYEFTEETGEYDEDGIPIVERTTEFTYDEMFFKLDGLTRMLKKEFLPTNVVIKDVIGEFIYFIKYVFRFWDDRTEILSRDVNEKVDLLVYPRGKLSLLNIKPLFPKNGGNEIVVPEHTFNNTAMDPFVASKSIPEDMMQTFVQDVLDFWSFVSNEAGEYAAENYMPWDDGDDFVTPSGCPVVLTFSMDEVVISELAGVTADDLGNYFTFDNLKYKNIYEIEWNVISSPGTMAYSATLRGKTMNAYRIAQVLPYEGQYDVYVKGYDLFGGATLSIHTKLIVVSKREVELVAFRRCEDKFSYKFSDLKYVRIEDFNMAPGWFQALNVIDSAANKTEINPTLMRWSYYRDKMYTIEIKDSLGVFVPYDYSTHKKKKNWGLNGKSFLTIEDLKDANISDLYFMRGVDTYFQSDFLPGFTFSGAQSGDVIRFMPRNSPDGLGYEDYVIPSLSPFTLESLAAEMNSSNHPAVSMFSYVVDNGKIHGNARMFDKKAIMTVQYVSNSVGSPVITGDEYTFNEPPFIFTEEFLDSMESLNPNFKRETMFMEAPMADRLNGQVNDPQYWERRMMIRAIEGDYDGYIPSTYFDDSFAVFRLKAHDGSFFTPMHSLVFLAINNSQYTDDVIWTLSSVEDKEDVITVKGAPFFVWRFDSIGRFSVSVTITDKYGNVTTDSAEAFVNVLGKSDYVNYVETLLTERAHALGDK